MSSYLLAPEAEEDVFQIWTYLAEKASPKTDDRIELKLYQAFDLLEKTPTLGHRRLDLTEQPVLFFRVRPFPYLIVYRVKTQVEVVAVLHGKRDIAKILQDRIT